MRNMCLAAIRTGVREIGFTEHYDLTPYQKNRDWFTPDAWFQEIERCRVEFAGALEIRAGIEIGEPHLFQSESEAMLSRYPFDYAIGSLHWVGAESVFDRNYFECREPNDAWRLFFEELEKMTQIGGFDVLGHLDVPVRVGFDVYGKYDVGCYESMIRPILANCVRHGIALDVNTAAMRRRAQQLTPGREILQWYAEMGGERIVFGSDAHRPATVGAKIDVAMGVARHVGIGNTTRFEQRKASLFAF